MERVLKLKYHIVIQIMILPLTEFPLLKAIGHYLIQVFMIMPINNYFLNADSIQINVYSSDDTDSNGCEIGVAEASWVGGLPTQNFSVAYITYAQNLGFIKPTVLSGANGVIDNPNSDHIEGFRISPSLPNMPIVSRAYVDGLGWTAEILDGTYCGTMYENRALEAITLSIDNSYAAADQISFNYLVYLKEGGWTDWVNNGEEAGTPDSGDPIQSIEIQVNN